MMMTTIMMLTMTLMKTRTFWDQPWRSNQGVRLEDPVLIFYVLTFCIQWVVLVLMTLSEGDELLNMAVKSLTVRENTLPVFWNLWQCLFGEHNLSQFRTRGNDTVSPPGCLMSAGRKLLLVWMLFCAEWKVIGGLGDILGDDQLWDSRRGVYEGEQVHKSKIRREWLLAKYFILFQIVVSVYQWEDFSRHLFLEMCQESRVKDERPGGCCCWRNSGQYWGDRFRRPVDNVG